MAQNALRKVALIGSGNWGSTVAKIIGNNVSKLPHFDSLVNMYVYEEYVDGKKLTDIINTQHENVRYLPGIKLPENIVAVPTVTEACNGADVLVFVVPHQFVVSICEQIKGKLPSGAVGISLIKGLSHAAVSLQNMSDVIESSLGINCSALMGANLAHEVAAEQFSESTIGCSDNTLWPMWKELFHCKYFKVNCVPDVYTVELCGAIKNVVAIGAGIVDGLKYGDNTKAALIRLGLIEMKRFIALVSDNVTPNENTFLESCGIADLITTCYGGRNRKLAEAFVTTKKTFAELEKEMLNGQKLQGPMTSSLVYDILQKRGVINEFPILSSVYRICYEGKDPKHLIDLLEEYF